MIFFIKIAILALISAGTWFLTGLDQTVAGASKRSHHFTRALRTVAVTFLMMVYIWFVCSDPGLGAIPLLIIIPPAVALLLRSAVAEVFTHGVLRFIDPQLHDQREFDPKKVQRYQDVIAHLIHHGRREEAIKLCEELKESGAVDLVPLESTLEFLGVKQERAPVKPLTRADHLRAEKKFAEAEQLLKSLLRANPVDTPAALMLMRIYAEDLRQPDQAWAVLHALEKRRQVRAEHLEFARRSIVEWSHPARQPQPPPLPPRPAESVDELLAQGSFGIAVERLEAQIQAQPKDPAWRLKLAEVYAVNCHNPLRAEKVLREVERLAIATPEQLATAHAKLRGQHETLRLD